MHAFPLYNLDCVTCINFPLIALGIYFWFNAEGLWFQCQNASVSSYECLKWFPVTRPAQGNLKNRQTRQPLLISWDESDFGHTILLIHCIYLYPKRLISLLGWWDTDRKRLAQLWRQARSPIQHHDLVYFTKQKHLFSDILIFINHY